MSSQAIIKLSIGFYVFLFFLYLFGPLMVMSVTAFNTPNYPQAYPFEGFTLDWFVKLWNHRAMMEGLWNSIVIGLGVVAVSVPVGLAASVIMTQIYHRARGVFYLVTVSPVLTPGVIIGISTVIFWKDMMGLTDWTKATFYKGIILTILGQSSFITAYCLLIIMARLQRFDRAQEEAALDLGASYPQVFWHILLPFLKPAMISAAVIAFLTSFENYNTTTFAILADKTLVTVLAGEVRQGTTPALSALAVIIIGLSLIGAVAYELAKRREEGAAKRATERARIAERAEVLVAQPGMIARYARPEMTAIWSPETRFRIWFEIEAHAADAMAALGLIPRQAARVIWEKGSAAQFNVARIDEIERETKHDVIAFLTHLAEIVGPEARFVHQGMTSSDVLDTCFNLQLLRATDLLIADVDMLLAQLKRRAVEHKHTICIGRSHGIHAEPTTFGLKLAQAHAEFARGRARLMAARTEVATCAISGAVGTFANIDPRVEAHVAKALGLSPEPVSTQIVPRDRHAMYFATLGVVASSIERLATEIRHLQRTEVLEVEEYFAPGQKGSSAMPHKRNPVLTENLTGLARLVRSAVTPALENVALWHERDISHSAVERGIGPDATTHLDFALRRLAGVIEKLVVYPDNMKRNLDKLGGLIHSQRVLLALTQKGLSREAAYAAVQRNAMPVWRGEGDFLELLKRDPEVSARLPRAELEALFDLGYHTKHVETIFERVFPSTGGR